ncbi:MAG TPA: IS701 family transposase, partial [Planctomycetes bacterium]|nr:IS701 family transposase [Planctomycetota bacterium]
MTMANDARTRFRIMDDPAMPSVVDFPTIVKDALDQFGDLFANEPERVHFAEYLTGLFIAEHKNVSAINRQFVQTTDQSCLNRWLTQVPWDVSALNRRRLAWLQEDASTRYSTQGVIALDNVLIDHDGKRIEDVGYFWDHAEKRHKVAHDYLIANYVCTSGKHYPIEFRRFIQRERCEERDLVFHDHNVFFRELVDLAVKDHIPGDFTFDSWFTHAKNLNHIHGHDRGYVGDLKFNRNLSFQGRTIKAEALAQEIGPSGRKPVVIDGKQQWYFTRSIRLPDVDHRVRIVILWRRRNGKNPQKMLVCNRTHWEVSRILRVYRRRWQGTECFHRDGKQSRCIGSYGRL